MQTHQVHDMTRVPFPLEWIRLDEVVTLAFSGTFVAMVKGWLICQLQHTKSNYESGLDCSESVCIGANWSWLDWRRLNQVQSGVNWSGTGVDWSNLEQLGADQSELEELRATQVDQSKVEIRSSSVKLFWGAMFAFEIIMPSFLWCSDLWVVACCCVGQKESCFFKR